MNNLADLRRYVAEQADNVQVSCYSLSYDDLVEEVTRDFLHYLRGRNFQWGDELPITSHKEFWDLFKPYEKEL